MEAELATAAWGERQTFACLVAVGSIIMGGGLIRLKPDAPDMARAHALPAWRKAVLFVPSSAYLWFATWRQPPVQHTANLLADVFGDFAFYDPIVYMGIVVVSVVAATDLTGGRASRLAFSALGGVLLLFVGLIPVVLGLHVILAALGAS